LVIIGAVSFDQSTHHSVMNGGRSRCFCREWCFTFAGVCHTVCGTDEPSMKTKTTPFRRMSAILTLFAVAGVIASAQMNPITVKLTKKVSYEARTRVGYSTSGYEGGYGILQSSRTVSHTRHAAHYSIEVLNNTMRKYDDVKVKWTVLVKPSNGKE